MPKSHVTQAKLLCLACLLLLPVCILTYAQEVVERNKGQLSLCPLLLHGRGTILQCMEFIGYPSRNRNFRDRNGVLLPVAGKEVLKGSQEFLVGVVPVKGVDANVEGTGLADGAECHRDAQNTNLMAKAVVALPHPRSKAGDNPDLGGVLDILEVGVNLGAGRRSTSAPKRFPFLGS